ncbi:response regulator [Geotalea toluenoxydans]
MKECSERELWILGLGENPGRGALICSYLAEAGYWARTASLSELSTCKPLGILLDISPYAKDGWGILLEIKNNPETRDIPVLPLYLSEEGKVGEVFPVAGFFTLPIDPEYVMERLAVFGLIDDIEDYDLQVLVISRKGEEQVAKTLQNLGFEAVNAYTGKEGVAVATISHPYLIFSTLMLQDMGAFEILERFRLYPQTRNIPFFILLKDNMKAGERTAMSRQVDHLVRKKVLSKEEFLSYLRKKM